MNLPEIVMEMHQQGQLTTADAEALAAFLDSIPEGEKRVLPDELEPAFDKLLLYTMHVGGVQ